MIAMLRHMKRSLLAPIAFAQYAAVGLPAPQTIVTASFTDDRGEARDVTANHVVVALRPLTIGVMFERGEAAGLMRMRLEFHDRERRRRLGSIRLRRVREIAIGSHEFILFEISGSTNRCLSAPLMQAYHRVEAVRVARYQRKNPHNFALRPRDLRALFVYYVCPRPVVLVSVAHNGAANVFPMDLIGPTASPWFSMALRLTSGAVPLMTGSKRMALASLPLGYRSIAYELGKHHKASSIDPTTLPFETEPSPAFGLPVAKAALDVRDVEVVEHHEVGSHMLFLTRVVQQRTLAAAVARDPMQLPLHHMHGAFRRYLQRQRVPIAEIES